MAGGAGVGDPGETGDSAKSILAAAKQEQADVIVMGGRGLGEIEGLRLGGASHKVASLAPSTRVSVRQAPRRSTRAHSAGAETA